MTTARDEVLTRVRAALADNPTSPDIPRDYQRTGDHPPGSEHVIELMIDRLVDYRALVRRASAETLAAELAAALTSAGSVVVAPDLPAGLRKACAPPSRRVVVDTDPVVLSATDLDGIDAVVTAATVAIAISGTIVLDGGPGQGRRAITLVPDHHVVVLRAEQIVETVAEGIARLKPTRPITMIAGPSATSDIELSRVEGVHGPRTLEVIIVAG